MQAYVIIGRANARKSSVIRSLVGIDKSGLRDIASVNGRTLKIYASVSSLQESPKTPQAFLDEVGSKSCEAVVFCLWPQARPKSPSLHPDALSYLRFFQSAGWNIQRVAVLGGDTAPDPYSALVPGVVQPFPDSRVDPINITAESVRTHFGWR